MRRPPIMGGLSILDALNRLHACLVFCVGSEGVVITVPEQIKLTTVLCRPGSVDPWRSTEIIQLTSRSQKVCACLCVTVCAPMCTCVRVLFDVLTDFGEQGSAVAPRRK